MKKQNVSNKISSLLLVIIILLISLSLLKDYKVIKIDNAQTFFIYILIFVLPIIIYCKINKYKFSDALSLRHVKIKYYPFILFYSISTSIICAAINFLGLSIYTKYIGTITTSGIVSFNSSSSSAIFLTMVLLPAVTEELLMRGIALYEYEKYGVAIAIILTSIIFSIFHANPLNIISLFVAGVFYAVLTKVFDSVYPAIFAHVVNNGIAVIISKYKGFINYIFGDAIFVIIAIISLFAILFITLKLFENVMDDFSIKGKLKTNVRKLSYGDPLLSIYLYLFVGLCILKMFI